MKGYAIIGLLLTGVATPVLAAQESDTKHYVFSTR
jgi:hypothetical protein